ncbi:hypothetical protein BURKHO8Y_20130 [Burkholderia sp. 8Y]|uniref:hypothetical protein n=1 Tax=Burkholderia sp. 8Y TaxID=2653133 RepID=UPI0012F1D543|nr:hypothetical protein [Burkholderia sp. 8Y]VXC17666.1 hypothetical protein BURKHO8Y_20130 [Burkholderia sp. 8Y]
MTDITTIQSRIFDGTSAGNPRLPSVIKEAPAVVSFYAAPPADPQSDTERLTTTKRQTKAVKLF